MRKIRMSLPVLAATAGTRGMLGAGTAFLVGDRIPPRARKKVGWTLFAVGALSTVPIVVNVIRQRQRHWWQR